MRGSRLAWLALAVCARCPLPLTPWLTPHTAPAPTHLRLPHLLQGFRPADLTELLKKVPIKQGGGKLTTSLADLLPSGCTQDLERICEDWARDA